jgi:hypothetical protein
MASVVMTIGRGEGSHQVKSLQDAFPGNEADLLWVQIEARLPDLFVAEPARCEIEVFKLEQGSNLREIKNTAEEAQKKVTVHTLQELKPFLEVRRPITQARQKYRHIHGIPSGCSMA